MNILIVQIPGRGRTRLTAFFHEQGHEAVLAGTVREALASLTWSDAIIMSPYLGDPKMRYHDLAGKLREEGYRKPIILFSSIPLDSATHTYTARAFRSGFDTCITNTEWEDTILTKLNALMMHRS